MGEWPGLQANRDGVEYDATKIANVAEALGEILEPLNGMGYASHPGSIIDLSTNTSMIDQGVCEQLRNIDNWESGPTVATTLETAHRELLTVYQEVLENLGIAISLINAGAGNYQMTNTANQGG